MKADYNQNTENSPLVTVAREDFSTAFNKNFRKNKTLAHFQIRHEMC